MFKMSRLLTIGLLASTMLAMAVPAAAQREDRGGGRGDGMRGSRGAPQSQTGGGFGGGAERQRGPAPTVQNVPVRPSSTNRDWTERRAPRGDASGAGSGAGWNRGEANGGWNRGDRGNGAGGGSRWGNGTPPVTTTPPPMTPPPATQPAVRPDRGGEGQRNWTDRNRGEGTWNRGNDRDRGNDRGNNWNGGNDNRGNDADRGNNWNRGNDNRGNDANRGNNWNRGDNRWNNNSDRADWNRNRDWNNGRRLAERDRWANTRRWDNGWRNDRRYDWNGYRTQYRSVYRMPAYRAPYGWSYGYRQFSVGIFLSNVLFSSSYWLDDPYRYRLPPAYGPMRWVRYYDDALLVDTRDGYVVDVIHDFFW